MMNESEMISTIWAMENCLHGVIFSSDGLASSIVRLLFLKYAVDNNIGATDVESMQYCAKAQKMFAIRDTENGLDTIIPVLRNIDRAYHLDQIISSDEVIDHYATELFGMNKARQKKNVTDQNFKFIMDKLGSLDLEEKSGNKELGQMLVNSLIPRMAASMDKNRLAGEVMTNPGLAKLAKGILNVAKHDIFCDFTAGKGISTIEITGDVLPDVNISDVDHEAIATSAMLLIMYGYSHFKAVCGNSLVKKLHEIGGNKVFADPPIGAKLGKSDDVRYSNSTLAAIDRVLHGYLQDDGIAVITTPSGPLFSQGQAASIKEEIVTLGVLQAVIALPPMWAGTSVGTNLLVINKKPSWNILFIDASDRVQATEKKRTRSINILSEELIQKIIEVIHNPRDIPEFAKVVSGQDVSAKEYSLIPANYVVRQIKEDTTTLAEIDEQLADLYQQLGI